MSKKAKAMIGSRKIWEKNRKKENREEKYEERKTKENKK